MNVLANLPDSIPQDIIHADVAMSTASCMNFERKFLSAKRAGFSGRIPRTESKSVLQNHVLTRDHRDDNQRWVFQNSDEAVLVGTVGAVAFSGF